MLSRMKLIGFRILLAGGLILPLAAFPFARAAALEVDHDGTLEAGETVDDDFLIGEEVVEVAGTVNGNLIAGGTRVTISGTVNGDVIAGGSVIAITGTVNGNVFAGANTLTISGTVTGSVFYGGNQLVLAEDARVGSNLYFAGNSAEIRQGAVVARDAQLGGNQMLLEGEVGRDLNAALEALHIAGTAKIGRNVNLEIAPPEKDRKVDGPVVMPFYSPGLSMELTILPSGLRVEQGAQIGGKLAYTSPADQKAAILAAPEGGVVYTYRAMPEGSMEDGKVTFDFSMNPAMVVLEWLLGIVRDFFTLALIGLLGVWLLPTPLERCTKALRTQPLASFGYGFLVILLAMAALPVMAVAIFLIGLALGLVTLGGLMALIWSVGFAAMGFAYSVFFAVAVFVTKVIVSLVVGYWIFRLFSKDYAGSAVWPMLVGLMVFVLLHAIPILGWLISLVVITFGLGAILLALREQWRAARQAPAAQ